MATTATVRPNGAGTYTNIDAQYPATGSHYDKVDEASADDATTYVLEDGTSFAVDTYALASMPAAGRGTINSVKVYAKCITQPVGEAKIAVYVGSTVYYGSTETLGGSWAEINKQWTTSPDTGVAWTWAELDALEAGVSLRKISGGGSLCTQVYVEVNYDAASFVRSASVSLGLVATLATPAKTLNQTLAVSLGLTAIASGDVGSATWLCVASKDSGSVKTKDAVGTTWTVLAEDGAEAVVSSAYLTQFDNRLVSIAYEDSGFAYSQWYKVEGAVWTHIEKYPNWPQRFTDLFVDKDADDNPRLCFLTREGMYYLQEPFSEFSFGPTEVNWEFDEDAGKVGLYKWGYTHIAVNKSIFQTKAGVTTLIGPDRDDGLPTDLQGVITDMIGVGFWLVIAIDGGTAHKSCILKKYLSGNHWQPVYVGSVNTPIRALMWDSGTLYFGEGTNMKSLSLPAVTDNYTLDDTHTYAASGDLYTPWFHSEFESMTKVAHRVRAVTQDCDTDETLTVSYRTDANTAWTSLGTFNTSPTDDALQFASGVGLEFERIQFKVAFARGTTTTNTPKLERLIFDYTVHPPVLWAWTVRVKAQTIGDYSGSDIIAALKTAMETNTLLSFYPNPTEDSRGTQYLVSVSGMPGNEMGGEYGTEGVYLLQLQEVT